MQKHLLPPFFLFQVSLALLIILFLFLSGLSNIYTTEFFWLWALVFYGPPERTILILIFFTSFGTGWHHRCVTPVYRIPLGIFSHVIFRETSWRYMDTLIKTLACHKNN